MKKYIFTLLISAITFFSTANDEVKLPAPLFPEMTLEKALKQRQTTRNFQKKNITLQELSTLLWAAFGINRAETNKRTAPSTFNFQDIEIFIFTAEAVYRYLPENHKLLLILNSDERESAGIQEYVSSAPVSFIYVSNLNKMVKEGFNFSREEKLNMAALNAGHISQNLNLAAAALGLGAVTRGSIDKDNLKDILSLPENMEPVLGQTTGYKT